MNSDTLDPETRRSYRSLFRTYPPAWRADHEDVVLDTLLSVHADAGRTRPNALERAQFAIDGLRVQLTTAHRQGAERRPSADGENPQLVTPDGVAEKWGLTLRRARIQSTVLTAVFATMLGFGIVAFIENPSNSFPLIAIALILLGGINGAISASRLRRVTGEQRQRDIDRRIASSDQKAGRAFDQTNGIVDLGGQVALTEPEGEEDRARRLSSMNAAGIAYGNGTR